MNIEQGLIRISVVFWSLAGLFFGALLGVGVLSGSENDATVMGGLGIAGLIASLLGHKATKWIIGGFFAPKS